MQLMTNALGTAVPIDSIPEHTYEYFSPVQETPAWSVWPVQNC